MFKIIIHKVHCQLLNSITSLLWTHISEKVLYQNSFLPDSVIFCKLPHEKSILSLSRSLLQIIFRHVLDAAGAHTE